MTRNTLSATTLIGVYATLQVDRRTEVGNTIEINEPAETGDNIDVDTTPVTDDNDRN